jgi:hypothetical protein
MPVAIPQPTPTVILSTRLIRNHEDSTIAPFKVSSDLEVLGTLLICTLLMD